MASNDEKGYNQEQSSDTTCELSNSDIYSDFQRLDRELKTECSHEELRYFSEDSKCVKEIFDYIDNYEFRKSDCKEKEKRLYCRPSSKENVYNAWYMKCRIQTTKQGKLADKKIAIKDNVAVANIPMMNGSTILEGYIPEYDATVVQMILSHGGTIVGKTTCEDMCMTCVSYFTKYGPVRNPNNEEYSAGGSSSGNAVVVRNGEVDMAIGGDQGGSIRIPASHCGIVGLKPTFGLVPYTGACSMGPSFDHLGPMANNVADCALLLECIAGYDREDGRQNKSIKVHEYSKLIYPNQTPSKKLSIGILKEGLEVCDSDIQNVFMKAIDKIKSCKYFIINEIAYLKHVNASNVYSVYVGSCLRDMLWNNYGSSSEMKGFQSPSLAKHLQDGIRKKISESCLTLKYELLTSSFIHEKYGTCYRAKAANVLSDMKDDYDELLSIHDVIVMPTATKLPPKIPREDANVFDKLDPSLNLSTNVQIFNVTGHPAISINCGYYNEFPVGLQIVGKEFDELTVLTCASITEEILSKES